MIVRIQIPGIPTPLSRHRSAMCGSKIRQYDSQKVKKRTTKSIMVYELAKNNIPNILDYDYYCVTITFTFYKPKRLLIDCPEHNHKPDLDNLIKYVLDCGNDILWTDDSKVTEINSLKQFGTTSNTEIQIMPKKIKCKS